MPVDVDSHDLFSLLAMPVAAVFGHHCWCGGRSPKSIEHKPPSRIANDIVPHATEENATRQAHLEAEADTAASGCERPATSDVESPLSPSRRRAVALDRSRPIRFLCIHGSGANAMVMNLQTRALKREMGAAATFDYVQGAVDWKPEHVDEELLSLFGQGPYFGWWNVHMPDGTSVNKPSDYHDQLDTARERYHLKYAGVEDAMRKIEDHISAHGPFDILLGFSQGAILTSLLTAHCLQRKRVGGLGPSWAMNVLVCGMIPRDKHWIDLMEQQPINFPACIVIGKRDRFFSDGRRLAELYVEPELFEHQGGHEFPASTDPVYSAWMKSLRSQLKIDSR
ncbi:hypothetical protein AB1Y20_001222 [Prymnesium parvum]|uniref:Serine hydrolase domain-containing protein n=1 Tax=Prymnesium parvum TaxID=97485 RepID=A0AB34KAT2_PRYPA